MLRLRYNLLLYNQNPVEITFSEWYYCVRDVSDDVTLTCMARTLRGMSSRYCLMVKCHVLIRIRSSKANSRIRRPSVHTYTATREQHVRESVQGSVFSLKLIPTFNDLYAATLLGKYNSILQWKMSNLKHIYTFKSLYP